MPLIVAILLDLLFAEPPVRVHPVVWIGKYLDLAGRRLSVGSDRALLWKGALAWGIGAGMCLCAGFFLDRILVLLPAPGRWFVEGILLWPLFSIRMLFSEVASVEKGLSRSLEEGRARLSRIVSRDSSALSETEVRESALESLSENLSDSVIAPLLWWALLGLPGILLYRFSNTADACWGYRGAWEWKGKWAAIADDVLNWLPSRITAMLLGGFLRFGRLRIEAARTPSPNGGWPMGALALGLGIRLSKPGAYVLNPTGRSPGPRDTRRALRLCDFAVALGALLTMGLEGLLHGRF